MSILKISQMGHPVLLQKAEPIDDPSDAEISLLIDDMLETMADAAGLGLAAPQVYRSCRLIVFHDREDAKSEPPTVLLNPEIEPLDDRMEFGLEGCLSIPGIRGLVPRFRRIGYRGIGRDGRSIEREAEGLHARVIQHEVDHLDGVLYPMRMTDLSRLSFDTELQHFIAHLSKGDEQRDDG